MNQSTPDFYRHVQSQKSHLTLPIHIHLLKKWTMLFVDIPSLFQPQSCIISP